MVSPGGVPSEYPAESTVPDMVSMWYKEAAEATGRDGKNVEQEEMIHTKTKIQSFENKED